MLLLLLQLMLLLLLLLISMKGAAELHILCKPLTLNPKP